MSEPTDELHDRIAELERELGCGCCNTASPPCGCCACPRHDDSNGGDGDDDTLLTAATMLEDSQLKLAAVVQDNFEKAERISVLQRQVSDLAESHREVREQHLELATRHRRYSEGIAGALGDRKLRETGEPARSDREEILMLKHQLHSLALPATDQPPEERSTASLLIGCGFKVQALSMQQELDLTQPSVSVYEALERVYSPTLGPLASVPLETARLMLREPAWEALRGVAAQTADHLYDRPRLAEGLHALHLIVPVGSHEWDVTERGRALLSSQRKVAGALDFLHRVRTQKTDKRHVLATEIDEQLGTQVWSWNEDTRLFEVSVFRGLLPDDSQACHQGRMQLDDAVGLVVAGYEALKLRQARDPS